MRPGLSFLAFFPSHARFLHYIPELVQPSRQSLLTSFSESLPHCTSFSLYSRLILSSQGRSLLLTTLNFPLPSVSLLQTALLLQSLSSSFVFKRRPRSFLLTACLTGRSTIYSSHSWNAQCPLRTGLSNHTSLAPISTADHRK